MDRYVFSKRSQGDNENIDAYHTELRKLSITMSLRVCKIPSSKID